MWRCSLASLVPMIGYALLSVPAAAQDGREGSSANTAQAKKPFAFEVFSIRLHKPGTDRPGVEYMPDGYRISTPLVSLIDMAYLPLPGYRWGSSKLLHAPAWVGDDIYDVEARVAPEDQAIWQQAYAGRDFEDSELLRSAIREALKERCKIAVHVTPVEQPYWNIVMGKHGATLKETVPGAIKPVVGKSYAAGKGFYIQDNGKRQFVGVSMDDLARVLMRLTKDYPVQDRTGLAGRYDFILPWLSPQQYPESEISVPLDRMPLSGIGLMLERGKGPGFVIDIDRIERPSEN